MSFLSFIGLAEQHVLFLNGESQIKFAVKESYRRNQLLQAVLDGKDGDSQGFGSIEVKMRTVNKNGVLLVCWGPTALLNLKVSFEKSNNKFYFISLHFRNSI